RTSFSRRTASSSAHYQGPRSCTAKASKIDSKRSAAKRISPSKQNSNKQPTNNENPNVSILALTNGQVVIAEVVVQQNQESGELLVNLVNPCAITQSEPDEKGLVNASFTPIATLCANQTVQ